MLQNYFKIAWRNLKRRPGYTFINTAGLAVALACCLLIGLHVLDEWSYDQFHVESDRIVQVLISLDGDDGLQLQAQTPPPLADALTDRFPSVEHAVQVTPRSVVLRSSQDALVEEVLFAGPAFFEIFSFDLIAGNPDEVLAAPGRAVLSRSAAQGYFGSEDIIGQTFEIEAQDSIYTYQVAGISEDVPANSTIDADVVLSQLGVQLMRAQAPEWALQLPALFAQVQTPDARENLSQELPAFTEELHERGLPDRLGLQLLPLTERRSTPGVSGQIGEATNPAYPYILLAIAGLLLLIACVNFTTLAIAQAAPRSQEVGTRKALGAKRYQLASQFFSETFLLVATALAAGLLLARASMPLFNTLIEKELTVGAIFEPTGLLLLFAVLSVVTLLAGMYPALHLSRFAPTEAIRRQPQVRGQNRLKQGLVVAQFAVAVFLIASTLLMMRQMDLLQERDLGFDPEGVVQISTQQPGVSNTQMLDHLRNTAANRSEVVSITGSSLNPGSDRIGRGGFEADGRDTDAQMMRLDDDGIDALGLHLIEGRDFSQDGARDDVVIVNESFVEAMEWDEPVGQTISGSIFQEATVIGVVQDFHLQSLHHPITPLVIHKHPAYSMPMLYARLALDRESEGIAALEEAWSEVAPEAPFEYAYMTDVIDQLYSSERQWSRIVTTAGLLALFIAGLGLFGLAKLSAVQRRQEIGIRKVLGATAQSIVALLSKDFLKLVLIGFILATPVAYYIMSRWLEDFAYRIDIGPMVFILAGLAAGLIALLTVSYQALRAAWMNPTEAIRNE